MGLYMLYLIIDQRITSCNPYTMEQPDRLFSTLGLLSDGKSFELGMDRSVQNLWILNHLADLEIKEHKIIYQEHRGYRQRKTTEYPIRTMRKPFRNTRELLEYFVPRRYSLHVFELVFTNGWNLKVAMNWNIRFRTGSEEERNALIVQLFAIEGIRLSLNSMHSLKQNYSYRVTLSAELILMEESHLPDEFWDEDRVEEWQQNYQKNNQVNGR